MVNEVKHFVRSPKALSYVNRVLMYYSAPNSMLRDGLRDHRRKVKAFADRFRRSEHLPCGYQDMYGDALENAALDLRATLDALWLQKGIQSDYFRNALERAFGFEV